MGGRGDDSKINTKQISSKEIKLMKDVEKIKKDSDKKRALNSLKKGGSVGGNQISAEKKNCACCGNPTLTIGSTNETCSICGWIDDPYQNQHLDSLNGANSKTLRMAREEYAKKIENDQSG